MASQFGNDLSTSDYSYRVSDKFECKSDKLLEIEKSEFNDLKRFQDDYGCE